MKTKHISTLFAIPAAALYAINIPFSKLLLAQVQPTMMAALLYLGAGLGLLVYKMLSKEKDIGGPLTKKRTSIHRWDAPPGHCRPHFADAGSAAHRLRQRIPFE